MAVSATVEEIVPLVEALSPEDRVRLLRLLTRDRNFDALVYRALPPGPNEFASDEDPLAWDSNGWDYLSQGRWA